MSKNLIDRRRALGNLAGLGGLALFPISLLPRNRSDVKKFDPVGPFTFCLNTSTIREKSQGLVSDMELAARAGYDGIEIWVNALQRYVNDGGKPEDIARRASDLGIRVENAIGFASWIVDDPAQRKQGLEQAKREMDMLARAGCHRLAAPPAGATETAGLDLDQAGERFRELIELGKSMDCMPQLEVWGFSKNLHTLSQVLYVAAAARHPDARILPDIYHLHKGGSGYEGIKLVSGKAIEVFHLNDYPAGKDIAELGDGDRIYPGEGIAPIVQVLKDLKAAGGPKVLSLELFNRAYWEQDPLEVARTGLQHMRSLAQEAVSA